MKAQRTFFAILSVAVLFLGTTACGRSDNRGAADRTDDSQTAADRAAPMDTGWIRDRDEYVNRRQEDLTKVEQRWEDMQSRANAQAKATWNDLKQESLDIRRELNEVKNTTAKENWELAKDRIDKRWDTFEDKTEDLFSGKRPQPATRAK